MVGVMSGSETIEVVLPDDARLLIRATKVEDADLVQIDGEDDGPADVALRDYLHFRHVTSSVRMVATELHKALQAAKPDVVSVDLGFDLAVKGSQLLAMIVDAGTHATINVHLEWHNTPAQKDPGTT
jgi:hypothetical protein